MYGSEETASIIMVSFAILALNLLKGLLCCLFLNNLANPTALDDLNVSVPKAIQPNVKIMLSTAISTPRLIL